MAASELERLGSDPSHWSPPGLYRCAADPRLIVLGMVVIAAGPTVALVLWRPQQAGTVLVTLCASILLLIAVSAWESERRR